MNTRYQPFCTDLSPYFKTSISSHLGEGMNQWGAPKPKNVIIIYLDRNLKFECRLIPTSKPHFRPTFGEGLSPWGIRNKLESYTL